MQALSRSLLFALTTATTTPLLDAQAYAAFVFDRSGSMNILRDPNNPASSRAKYSEDTAQWDIFWFYLFNPTGTCQIYTYQGTPGLYQPSAILRGTYTTMAAAQAAATQFHLINNPAGVLTTPSGNTPLAGAVCDATDGLVLISGSATPGDRTLYLYSDGQENSSPSTSCKGTFLTSASGDHCQQQGSAGAFLTGSWEQAVCDVIHNEITTNVYYFADFVDVPVTALFQALCDMTGGNFTKIDDDNPIAPGNPWRTLGRGCEDFHGTELSMRYVGLPQIGNTVQIGCRTSNPLPYILGVGLSTTQFGGNPLPFDLAPLGAPGCKIQSSWDGMEGFFPWNGLRNFNIPANAALVGLPLYYQGAQLHPLNNALGVATSNVLKMTISS